MNCPPSTKPLSFECCSLIAWRTPCEYSRRPMFCIDPPMNISFFRAVLHAYGAAGFGSFSSSDAPINASTGTTESCAGR